MRRRQAVLVAAAVLAATVPVTASAVKAPVAVPRVGVFQSVHNDTSRPLRDLVRLPVVRRPGTIVQEPVRTPVEQGPFTYDPVLQKAEAAAVTPATTVRNFEGIGADYPGYTPNAVPPDTAGAAGRTQYVQWVNLSIAVFDKRTGKALVGPAPGNSVFAEFGGECEQRNDGDPIVNYDRFANRWVIQQFAVTNGNYECIAVSKTPDATGAYHRYAFKYTGMNDYPKTGVWRDGYYNTYNMFSGESGAKVCAMDRAKMLVGKAATQQCVQLPPQYTSLLPADNDGTRLAPAGSPMPLVALGPNSLRMWSFKVDWSRPSRSKLTGPVPVEVAAYRQACLTGATLRATCVPQPGTGVVGQLGVVGLDAMPDRPMFRLAYRRFGDGREAMVVTHTVDAMPSAAAALRWYELRKVGSGWRVHQEGTYTSDDGVSRWMGSAAMDKAGNIGIGYSVSSATTVFPGIRYTGRQARDPLGTLGGERSIVEGLGEQTTASIVSRWGDYSTMTIDPVDDCTFWYTTEYMNGVGVFAWSTKIAAFKFPSCR
ncbi:MAG TPA: hypothetical protein VNA20_12455 [Frankiaceae bacterium]|nr:hypothetical protein [Frankiaceae bacterium]